MSVVPEDGEIAYSVRITGRVQGVWYRGWNCDEAVQRGLRGWVRNRVDGSVEALFAGPVGSVEQMIKACWQGPPAAEVVKIEVEAADTPGQGGFEQRPSAE
ncbi:MAG: acylphosphatase [Proteobacteria bacterium]|nr:acylphosphatase [Pseudomonadota bacterium]MDA1355061.1 acylphosphatase [Pseudomonadota bacterium]